ncbi:MAG: MMPL family transporter, partial [Planctomycetota bacterium]
EFKGFSDFGKLAGLGVLIIALSTYALVPALFLVITKVFPRFPDTLLSGAKNAADIESLHDTKFPRPGLTLVVLLVITGALSGLAYDAFASDRWFDYNARSLMLPDQSSVILQEEIDRRFEISSDPVGVYCATFDDYRDLFNELHPLDREKYPTVDAPISFLSFLPPMEQQEANVAVLAKMKRDVRKIKRDMLDEDVRENYDRYLEYLEVKPFTADDLPDTYEVQFRAIESVRAEHPGWLTFIYPKVALWDGRDLLEFDRDVGVIQTETGKEFHSTGMAILFAKLAEIVLHDGQQLTLLTFALVFFLVLLNFRKLGATFIALTPLVGGIVWMIGFMGLLSLLRENGLTPAWLDIRLNFINMVVLTLIFGYGIDTGIHLYHRYVESGSVMRALRMTGGAVIASMITALVGWGALIFAEHRGLRSMGMLACLGIASALIVSLTLVPALLQFIENVKGRPPEAATKETTP